MAEEIKFESEEILLDKVRWCDEIGRFNMGR
jgi:hypothetical protein